MTADRLVERLRERARALGLGPIGFAPVAPSDHAEALRRWLDRGHAATMTWMSRTARDSVDLERRFPWARSVVVAAQPYLTYGGDRHRQAGLVPHVARYATGADYHDTLGERLETLAGYLESEAPGARTRVYVDTGPLLERELAARAGLGWFGKSTNLILPGGNSWFLLGEILTSLDLPAGSRAPDRCGSCTACIDACPTAAIVEPYVVDSGRCISYLTIELRESLPPERERDLGDWLFGCDVCQEVCPWNRKAGPVEDHAFQPGAHLESASLESLVRLDERSFAERYAATPLARPGRRGLVRNALVVAANTGDEPALAAGREAVADADPVVRVTAARSLARAGGGAGRRAVERARRAESDLSVKRDLDEALG